MAVQLVNNVLYGFDVGIAREADAQFLGGLPNARIRERANLRLPLCVVNGRVVRRGLTRMARKLGPPFADLLAKQPSQKEHAHVLRVRDHPLPLGLEATNETPVAIIAQGHDQGQMRSRLRYFADDKRPCSTQERQSRVPRNVYDPPVRAGSTNGEYLS